MLGNDAWKGIELGVESSLRWRDEFKSFTRKVKAINDTDDVVDEVVIFSNKRFTREIEIGRERETPSFFSLSNAYFARNIAARLHLSSRISTISSSSSRKLEKWKRRGGKKARNGKARPPKFGCALRPNAVVDAEDTRMKGEKKKERIEVEVGNKRKEEKTIGEGKVK